MKGCAVVYIPGFTGSSSGSDTDESGASAANDFAIGRPDRFAHRQRELLTPGPRLAAIDWKRHESAASGEEDRETVGGPGESAALRELASRRGSPRLEGEDEGIVLLLADHAKRVRVRRHVEHVATCRRQTKRPENDRVGQQGGGLPGLNIDRRQHGLARVGENLIAWDACIRALDHGRSARASAARRGEARRGSRAGYQDAIAARGTRVR